MSLLPANELMQKNWLKSEAQWCKTKLILWYRLLTPFQRLTKKSSAYSE